MLKKSTFIMMLSACALLMSASPGFAANKTFHIKNCSKHHLTIDIFMAYWGAAATLAYSPNKYHKMHCMKRHCDFTVHWDANEDFSGMGAGEFRFNNREAGHYLFDLIHRNGNKVMAFKRLEESDIENFDAEDCTILTEDDYRTY